MTLEEDEAVKLLKANIKRSDFAVKSEEQSDRLFALMHGDKFIDLLINQIEHIESPNKALARKKNSRNVVHVFDRLLRPVSNVYSANGGTINLDVTDSEREILLSRMSRTRDGKSLREWLKTFWMPLYHSDPNGVIFIEYQSEPELNCWPTYKQISVIQSYKPRGQMLEWIIFKPVKETINNRHIETIRIVDDLNDRTYLKKGDQFTIIKERSFEHPFGQVPALINSDIEDLRGVIRLSPVNAIIPVAEEYAKDQSVKTLYKLRMGLPIEYKMEDQCITCNGSKKDSEGKKCTDCNGQGYYLDKDITDIKVIAAPEGDESFIKGEDTAGFIVPPVEVLQEMRNDLTDSDELIHATHWGTMAGFTSKVQKTATEVFFDTQPMTDKLNDYGDVAESMENQIIEWYANALFTTKVKDKKISSGTYGRRYIIDSPDVILEKYEKAKKEEDNDVILDRLYNEYQTAKYKRDPEFLRVMLLKSNLTPYLHLSLDKTEKYFGVVETQKKVLFRDWWESLVIKDKDKTVDVLSAEFDKWIEDKQPKNDGEANAATLAAQAELRGSVGGATMVKDLITAVSAGQVPVESAVQILINLFGYTDDVAKLMIGTPKIIIPNPSTTGGFNN